MSLRLRLTLVAALVVAVVVAIASALVYVFIRHDLRQQIDNSIKQHAVAIQQHPDDAFPHGPGRLGQFPSDFVQVLFQNGAVQNQFGTSVVYLPLDARVRSVAKTRTTYFLRDVTINKHHYREIVAPLPPPLGAVMIVRALSDVDHELSRLQLILTLVSVGGVLAAALAGALVSRATLAPVRRLTAAAERIAETGDPSERVVPTGGRDELARLGTAFNTMLAALEESIESQRRFVADASHELRTPLTSLQTNIEVMKQQERLAPEQRARLFADLEREAHEMRDLITALLELARGDANVEHTTVQLDDIVESAVERARSRFRNVHFNAHIEPTRVEGVPERLERAVWNLIENAGKWTTAGSSVDVTLSGGELRVRDHGPGIASEDKPRVFDRFYRATSARSQPGSGLGLAIVKDVADEHGGTVSAEDAPGGGALLRLRFTTS